MKIKIERIGNSWKISFGLNEKHEFFSSKDLTTEEIADFVITLSKFKGLTTEINFTEKN